MILFWPLNCICSLILILKPYIVFSVLCTLHIVTKLLKCNILQCFNMVNLKCINKGINVTWSWCYQNETLQWFWSKLLFLGKHIYFTFYFRFKWKTALKYWNFPWGYKFIFSDQFLLSNRLALSVLLLQMFTPICIYGFRKDIP